jgi:hypothetical protein
MTRRNDDKAGNNEFEGNEPKERRYNEKVEARFTKEATAKQVQGGDGKTPPKVGGSHADDGGEHRF